MALNKLTCVLYEMEHLHEVQKVVHMNTLTHLSVTW